MNNHEAPHNDTPDNAPQRATEAPIPAGFWPQIDHQLQRIADPTHPADTFDRVRTVLQDPAYTAIQKDAHLNGPRDFPTDAAFFAGSGGDAMLLTSLRAAGWARTWSEASYYYVARNVITGETLTYVEGDVLRGDAR